MGQPCQNLELGKMKCMLPARRDVASLGVHAVPNMA